MPFGEPHGMDVFVAKLLPDNEEIAFNPGSHTELVRAGCMDLDSPVRPKIADVALAGIH